MINALVPIADGTEEMEAVIVIDTLRRAKWSVTVAAVGTERTILASRGVRITADVLLSAVGSESFDAVVLPGGASGTDAFVHSAPLTALLQTHARAGKLVAAICAAPLALQAAGLLDGRAFTCHPGVADELTAGRRLADTVVIDGNLITSQGPGTAFAFALALIRSLEGATAASHIAANLLLPDQGTQR
jgi:protein deglycase